MKAVIGAIALLLPVGLVIGILLAFSAQPPASACTPAVAGAVALERIPEDAQVAGFNREQLANAAAIVNAAVAMKLPTAAQTIGVQAAIGESSLRNIAYGDGAINPDGSTADSIGLFQQQSSWGTVAQRMDPSTSATLFFQRLVKVPNWETLEPSVAINSVQINADPFHYTKSRAAAAAVAAYLATLSGGGSSTGCGVSGDAQQVAATLVDAMTSGKLKVEKPRYATQLVNMANGTATDGCRLDLPTLQLLALAVQKFGSVGVSDLNRSCAGDNLGTLAHWANGGGNAVDIVSLNGAAVNGSSPQTLALLDLLSSVAPVGTRVGQSNCRGGVGGWPNLLQFSDSCTHQHIDFLYAVGPLNVTG